MVSFQDCLSLARYNAKIVFGLNLLAAVALVLLTPFFFSLSLLTYKEMAKVGELYLCTTGIALFTFLGSIEEGSNSQEIVYSKRMPHVYIFTLRFLFMALASFIMIMTIAAYAAVLRSTFPFWTFIFGVWVSAVFLGTIGLTIVNFTREPGAGYLISFAYFVLEWMTRGKYTKDFFLLSLLNNSFHEKYRILAVILVILLANLLFVYKKS